MLKNSKKVKKEGPSRTLRRSVSSYPHRAPEVLGTHRKRSWFLTTQKKLPTTTSPAKIFEGGASNSARKETSDDPEPRESTQRTTGEPTGQPTRRQRPRKSNGRSTRPESGTAEKSPQGRKKQKFRRAAVLRVVRRAACSARRTVEGVAGRRQSPSKTRGESTTKSGTQGAKYFD